MKDTFTTSEVARICGISKQKVANLFDEHKLAGFRIPAPGRSRAGARRIPRDALLDFMRTNDIPTDALDAFETAAKKKILIVEDDRFSLELLHEIFSTDADDVELHSATTGADAAVLAGRLAPDLILLDLALPDLAGDKVFAAIRKVPGLASTKVVVVTAFSDETTRKRLLAMGAHAFIPKPIDPNTLRNTVRQLLNLNT